MTRPLNEIITQIRACIADPRIKTTLIQTEDLAALCDAASPDGPREMPEQVRAALVPKADWKLQPFEYYAAHFLIGTGLIHGDLAANIRSLAHEFGKQYDHGVEHGKSADQATVAAKR